jgi:hypothetical protein
MADHEGPKKPRPGKEMVPRLPVPTCCTTQALPQTGGAWEEIGLDSSHVLSTTIRDELYRADREDGVFMGPIGLGFYIRFSAIRPPYKLEEN